MLIAYQGEPGAFSEAAAANSPRREPALPAFEDVFDAVESGAAACGVLPIENSIGGSIHRNFDLLLEHELPIVGEVELPVVHHLLALPGTTLERVRRVYSHPQALAQCDRFLRTLTGRRDHRDLRHGGQREADRRSSRLAMPRPSPRRARARSSG